MSSCYSCVLFFFFKQKTAYEMRISDWSSDVCSSDLDLPQIGDPFVDQDRARRVFLEDRLEKMGAWRDAVGIILGDHGEGFCPAELPCQFAPCGTDLLAAIGIEDILWSSRRADQHRAIDLLRHAQLVIFQPDRKSCVDGKSVVVRLELGGRRIIT